MTAKLTTAPTGNATKRPSVCHSCDRTVVWVLLDGRRQPLDYLAAGGGNVALELRLPGFELPGDQLQRAKMISGVTSRYRRHIESCPQAGVWRDRWKKKAPARPFSTIKGKKTK